MMIEHFNDPRMNVDKSMQRLLSKVSFLSLIAVNFDLVSNFYDLINILQIDLRHHFLKCLFFIPPFQLNVHDLRLISRLSLLNRCVTQPKKP